MTVTPQITFRDFTAPQLADERIQERVDRLDRFHPRINSVRVVVEEMTRRHHKGKLFRFHIDVTVPGGELAVSNDQNDKHAHEDFFVAMRDAFNAMERQLKAYAEKHRGDVKTHEPTPMGTVRLLHPDYGFILSDEGLEIYFHANSVADGKFDTLKIGDRVRFVAVEGESEKGPQATTVHAVS